MVVSPFTPSCQIIAHSHCHQPVVADILPNQQETGTLFRSQLCCILYRAILERWLTRGRTQKIHSPRSFSNPFQARLLTLTSPTCGGMGDAQRVSPLGSQGKNNEILQTSSCWSLDMLRPISLTSSISTSLSRHVSHKSTCGGMGLCSCNRAFSAGDEVAVVHQSAVPVSVRPPLDAPFLWVCEITSIFNFTNPHLPRSKRVHVVVVQVGPLVYWLFVGALYSPPILNVFLSRFPGVTSDVEDINFIQSACQILN